MKTYSYRRGLNDIVFNENDPSTRQRYENDMKTIGKRICVDGA